MQELLDMKELFKQIIKQDVKPFFSAQGYRTKDLNFTKSEDQLIYNINIQKSSGNTWDKLSFYVNCTIHSTELAQLQISQSSIVSVAGSSHFTSRIREIVPAAPDRYTLTKEVDVDSFTAELLQHLDQALAFMYTLTDARSILDYYMERTALHLSEETFRFLLRAGETKTAKLYLKQLQDEYGAEPRWTIWEKKYAAIWSEYGLEL
ncbi:DUF4304 domain-containing protein [Paenibacillus sp. FSL H3-0469]|uniref:DUF4304 domain-containing protein n=1 Tax=Paenibacillus sp. FSL H3-0469 TaxID=2954506 RepID=UPI0031018642